MNKNIFLIGTGPMAVDYAKVLEAQKQQCTVIGRGTASAQKFEEITGIKPITGGIDDYLLHHTFPENSYVIIATGVETIMSTLLTVLNNNAKIVLVEKPAAISINQLLSNKDLLKPYGNSVFVGYNRRFYSSVIEAQKLINEDGGLQSLFFEFTEWAHKIEPLQKAPGIKENWFFANSTHVVDLAFYLAGNPLQWNTFSKSGELKWHKKTNFAGAGITKSGVIFSYLSNWESAGRWSVELLTKNRRIYLKPLESILIQNKGSIALSEHNFDDSLDKFFKPGLYKQVEAFLDNSKIGMLTLENHIINVEDIYSKIVN